MYLYKKTARPKNTAAKAVALILLLGGASTVALAQNSAILQLIGIITITAAIYIAAAYLLRIYTFSIEPNGNNSDVEKENLALVVSERRSNLDMKVCRIDLTEIKSVTVVSKENKKEVATRRKNKKKYTYNTEFSPRKKLEISALVGGDELSLLVTFDDELLKVLDYWLNN